MREVKTGEQRAALSQAIIARYDAKTGSSGAATYGPLVEALLEELFPAEPSPVREREGR